MTATAERLRKKQPSKKAAGSIRRQLLADEMHGMELLGQVITWNAHGPHSLAKVVQALKDSGLDESFAKEFKYGNAFSRACNQLAEERIIDVISQTPENAYFQLSKRHAATDRVDGGVEFSYTKEVKIQLEKATGKIICKDEAIKKQAEAELARAMEQRTTSDITHIVQQIFETNADLIPLRDRGAVYFVPQCYDEFILKVNDFLGKLGGKLNRLPIPAGTQYGDETIQDAVQDAMQKLIDSHLEAVKGFTLKTREETIKATAQRINNTRVRIEAYAEYLKDKSADLLVAVENAKETLSKQIEALTEQRKNVDPNTPGVTDGDLAMQVLTNQPKTMKEIVAEANLSNTVYDFLNKQIAAGKVVKQGKGYKLA